jgi:hypothetical protein
VGGQPARAAAFLRQRAADPRHLLRPADHGQQLGGKVAPSDNREFGRAFIEIVARQRLFDGLWASARSTRCG